MPSIAFNRAFALTSVFEGGFSNQPADKGGPTAFGISTPTLSAWRKTPVTANDVKSLTQTEAQAIYDARYWTPLRCDDYGSDALSAAVFDAGVLTGTNNASRMLQTALGVVVDGNIGPKTLAAVRAANKQNACIAFSALWQKYLVAIVDRDRTQVVFLIGWLRRAAAIQAYVFSFGS